MTLEDKLKQAVLLRSLNWFAQMKKIFFYTQIQNFIIWFTMLIFWLVHLLFLTINHVSDAWDLVFLFPGIKVSSQIAFFLIQLRKIWFPFFVG